MDILFTITLLILIVSLIFIILAYWSYSSPSQSDQVINLEPQIREIFISDSHLQRQLIMETNLNNKNNLLTINRVSDNLKCLTKLLIKVFGITTTQRLENLFQSRHDIIREYYYNKHQQINDLEDQTLDQLRAINQDLVQNIIFQVQDNNQQTLYDLLTMYDRELINQGRNYWEERYDLSANSAHSALELAKRLGSSLASILNQNQLLIMVQT